MLSNSHRLCFMDPVRGGKTWVKKWWLGPKMSILSTIAQVIPNICGSLHHHFQIPNLKSQLKCYPALCHLRITSYKALLSL